MAFSYHVIIISAKKKDVYDKYGKAGLNNEGSGKLFVYILCRKILQQSSGLSFIEIQGSTIQ